MEMNILLGKKWQPKENDLNLVYTTSIEPQLDEMVIEKGLSMLNLKNNFFIEIVSPGEAVQTTKNGHFSYWKGFSYISVFTILLEIID